MSRPRASDKELAAEAKAWSDGDLNPSGWTDSSLHVPHTYTLIATRLTTLAAKVLRADTTIEVDPRDYKEWLDVVRVTTTLLSNAFEEFWSGDTTSGSNSAQKAALFAKHALRASQHFPLDAKGNNHYKVIALELSDLAHLFARELVKPKP